jgi:hypothetical protein
MSYRNELEQKYGTPALGTVRLTRSEERGLWIEERDTMMERKPYGDGFAFVSSGEAENQEDMWFDEYGNQLAAPDDPIAK